MKIPFLASVPCISRTFGLILSYALFSCAPASQDSRVKIIGGSASAANYLGSFIKIPSCSGVLVNPTTIMTAAQCIHNFSTDGRIKSMYDPGRTFSISNNAKSVQVTVASAHIHPSWAKACTAARPCDPKRAGAGTDPSVSDLALIILKTPVTSIPHAKLDLQPTQIGEAVNVAGYGCEEGINTGASGNRKAMITKLVDGTRSLAHAGSERLGSIAETLSANFITPGKPDGGPSLCPGDSGGPVYRDFSASEKDLLSKGQVVREKLIGINADYTFTDGYERVGAIAKTNIHARFDTLSVRQWLNQYMDTTNGTDQGSVGVEVDKDIFIMLADGADSSSPYVYIGASASVTKVEFCSGDTIRCSEASSISFSVYKTTNSRMIYKSNKPVDLASGKLTAIALNDLGAVKSRKVIDLQPLR